MFSRDQAIQILYGSVLYRDENAPLEQRMIIFDDLTIEKPWGWIFFFNNEKYYRTRNYLDAVVGPGPVFFNRHTGEIRRFGSSCSLNDEIYDYEMEILASGKFWCLWLTGDQDRKDAILKIKKLLKLTTKRARDFVPCLPTPLFHGMRRHLDWITEECDAIELHTEIRLEDNLPACMAFEFPEHMISPTAAEAFHFG